MTRRTPLNRAQRGLTRPSRERFATRTLAFEVDGDRCRGTLVCPSGVDDPPVVVMGPGLGATRRFGYRAVAERFAVDGRASFVFDYRGFGDSVGTDHLIHPERQRADYVGALDRLSRVDALGTERVLWGTSLAAGHALVLGAERRAVDAVIAVSPVLDWQGVVRARGGRYLARAAAAVVRDRLGSRVGGGVTVPIVGAPGSLAALTEPGVRRGYLDLVDREHTWRNETPARSLSLLGGYRPIEHVGQVRAPTLLLGGADDPLVSPSTMHGAGERLDRGTVVTMPGTHVSPLGTRLETAIEYQQTFLRDVLGG
ncbi:alpha/beta hydrolase [Halorubrum sp. SY-15]|uniref:alpha/beta hydrolase n=1 Tax=Halorubrum sp. SY-15 TaxID=3402277 RepID=UPI003EBA902D